jgi:hypothetical protein
MGPRRLRGSRVRRYVGELIAVNTTGPVDMGELAVELAVKVRARLGVCAGSP